jgi:glycosyltransferase involved in cell wall biosynthesis
MNKIAIIIPIYNVGGDLLDRCLSSVTKCISLYRNIVVILVDDHSPKWDEESRVIYNYFDEPIIISHMFNRGLGAARNSGLFKALDLGADWVWFIDSDDSINPGTILNIIKDIESKM